MPIDFLRGINKATDDIQQTLLNAMDEAQLAIAKEYVTELVKQSPRQTGTLKSNWRVARGRPNLSHDPRKYRAPYSDESDIKNALAKVRTRKNIKRLVSYYISNTTPYIANVKSFREWRRIAQSSERKGDAKAEEVFRKALTKLAKKRVG